MPGLFSKASINLHNTLAVGAILFNLLSVLGSKRKKNRIWSSETGDNAIKIKTNWVKHIEINNITNAYYYN